MQFFDTHAHIGLIYDSPVEQFRVIQQAKQAGVTRIISINNSLHDFKKEYTVLKSMKGIYHAVGVGPSEVTAPGADWMNIIEESVKLPNVVAIGETGLDYLKQFGDKRSQIELFIAQLELAQKHSLPVIIHNRDAGNDIFDILKDRIPEKGAIFHCYSEDAVYAKKCLDAGMNVYIETESPFMIPAEFREKKRTMPAYLVSTAKFLAEMLETDLESLAAQLWTNSCKIFQLPE